MPSDKGRLYVALYARSGAPKMPGLEDTCVLPSGQVIESDANKEPATTGRSSPGPGTSRARASQTVPSEGDHDVGGRSPQPCGPPRSSRISTSMLLVRILVAKIKNRQRLESTLKSTPLRPEVDGWDCVGWAKEALEKVLLADSSAVGAAAEGWQSMRDTAMGVC